MSLGALLADGGELSGLTGQYIMVSFLGAPIIGIALQMMNYLGAENHPQLASAFLISANVINLILDFIFLKFTPLGTAGAALSTVLGYLLGMAVFVFYIRSPKRMISFHFPKTFRPLAEAARAGVPMLIFMVMSFVKALGLNFIIISTLGNDGMSIYTVCENVLMIVEMIVGGVLGIIPNIAGVLYGEKDYYGLRALGNRVLKISYIMGAVIMAFILAFPEIVTMMFGIKEGELLGITAASLRVFMLCLPFYLWNKFLISYYESIEVSKLASIVTFLQNGVFILPAAFIGITVVQNSGGNGDLAMAASYIVSELLTVVVIAVYRRIKYRGEDVYLLPEKNSELIMDTTYESDMKEATAISKEVYSACQTAGLSGSTAMQIAVAAEEMSVNCIRYGGKSSHWIDLSIVNTDEGLLLRIRDSGMPFDPTEYEYDEDIYESTKGIEIVRKLTTDITYIRCMDLNNTILKFQPTIK